MQHKKKLRLSKTTDFPMASFLSTPSFKNIKEGLFRLQLFAFALSVGGLSLFGFSMSLKCKLQY